MVGDSGDSASIRALTAGQERIEAALGTLSETVSRRFDELGLRYVPREELNQRFSGITEHQLRQDERLTGVEGSREVDRTALEARISVNEERHRVDRFNAKVVLLSGLTVLVMVLAIVIAHWK